MVESSAAERWLPVVGWSGFYEVSSFGKVRSIDRVVTLVSGRTRRYRGRILVQSSGSDYGHLQVALSRPGKAPTTRLVHQLVLEAFRGPRPEGCESLHGDGDSANNYEGNLKWGTSLENSLDVVRHGRHRGLSKTACPFSHLLIPPNLSGWHAANGQRGCLTCRRATARARYARSRGRTCDLRALRAECYAQIMQTSYPLVGSLPFRPGCP